MRRAFAFIALLCLPALLGVKRPSGLGDVTDIRYWSYPNYTRVVVELSQAAEPSLHRLPADKSAQRPERLYLDVPGIWVGRSYSEPIRVEDGLLHGVRVGQNTLDRTRVVIDLDRYGHHRFLRLSNPERLVVDVYAPDERHRRDGKGSTGRAWLPMDLRGVRTVVLDPGHGGRDPGAVGVGRLEEKDVTLRLAKRLRYRLEAMGFRVVLTREDDRYLDLEARTALAEGQGGDLFVSIHANAAKRSKLSGIETYYLDTRYEKHSVTVAARENGVPANRVTDLQRTIARLRVGEASIHSSRLADLLQTEMLSSVRGRFDGVADLGVKRGPFYVLFLANMPSVLLEVGFVTNKAEAKRLQDPLYLDALAAGVARGLGRYRDAAVVAELPVE